MALKNRVARWLEDKVNLNDQSASKMMELLPGEVSSICAADAELAMQALFLEQVESDRTDLQKRDLQSSVANAHEVNIKDDKLERFELYDELRSRGFGKSIIVLDKHNRLHEYRISQANWTVKCGDSYVINRLAPLAALLVSAKVGDEIEIPHVGEVEVVAERLLSGWNHIRRDIHQCVNTDELTDDKPIVVTGGKRLVNQWIENADSLLSDQMALEGSKSEAFALGASEQQAKSDSAQHDRMELAESDIDPLREQSLAADFYTRTTREQEELIRQPQSGVVAVEGVAGSGKTSVGLGRLKALHDAQFSSPESEVFTDFFNDKSRMRAFVLSPQLKGYLKKTLDELHLTNLPISDFEEFRKQLLSHHATLLAFKVPGVAAKNAQYSLTRANCSDVCYGYPWLELLDKALLAGISEEILGKLGWFEGRDLNVLPSQKVRGEELNYEVLIRDWIVETRDQIHKLFERKERSSTLRCMQLGRELEHILRDRTQYLQQVSTYYYHADQKKWRVTRARDDINPIEVKPWSPDGFGTEVGERLKKVRRRLASRLRDVLLLDSGSFKGIPTYVLKGVRQTSAPTELENEISLLTERLGDLKLAPADVDAMLVLSEALCFTSARNKSQAYDEDRSVDLYRASPRYSAVFIDEVQDFTEVQVSLMSLMADPKKNCVTVAGDFCQQLSQRRINDFSSCFIGRGSSPVRPFKLLDNKRQTKNLSSFSLHIRSKVEKGSVDLPPYIETKGELEKYSLSNVEWVDWLNDELGNIHPSKSVAVIFPTSELAEISYREFEGDSLSLRDIQLSSDGRDLTKAFTAHFTTALPAKGLEFDVVIIPYFNRFDFADPFSANSAYVAVSRPREKLVLLDIE